MLNPVSSHNGLEVSSPEARPSLGWQIKPGKWDADFLDCVPKEESISPHGNSAYPWDYARRWQDLPGLAWATPSQQKGPLQDLWWEPWQQGKIKRKEKQNHLHWALSFWARPRKCCGQLLGVGSKSGGDCAVTKGCCLQLELDHAFRGETGRKKQRYSAENLNESRFILSLLQISGDGVDLCVGKPNPATGNYELCIKPATSP